MFKQSLLAGVLLTLGLGGEVEALELKPSEIRGSTRKRPVSVLQNRFFTKAYRPEVGVSLGTFLNEAYTDTSTIGFRAAYFFGEWWGAELQMVKTNVSDSDDRKALNQLTYKRISDDVIVSPDPEVNAINGATDFNAVIAPFYGKLNMMNQLIIYSDLYFSAGLSNVDTAQGGKTAILLGAGQRFYWRRSLSLRIDFRDRTYTESRNGKDTRKHAMSIDFGMAYFFF